MSVIKFRLGSNQPVGEIGHLKQMMKCFTACRRHYSLLHDLLSYFMGEMLTNFVGKRMRDWPETGRFSDYVLSVVKAIFLAILRVIFS